MSLARKDRIVPTSSPWVSEDGRKRNFLYIHGKNEFKSLKVQNSLDAAYFKFGACTSTAF